MRLKKGHSLMNSSLPSVKQHSANDAPVNEAECALRLIESTPDGVALYDLSDCIAFANKKFCALWHLDQSALLGMSQAALYAHKLNMLSDPEQDGHLLLSHSGQDKEIETNYIRLKNGLWYERLAYDHMVNGECVGHAVQWRDVTLRHNALALVQLERDLLHDMMDSVPHQIYFKDTESRFTRINKALGSRYGLVDPQDAIGKSDADFYSAEHAAQTRQEELEIMTTLKPQINQTHHEVWADGTDAWNVSTKMPLVDAKGHVVGVYGIAHDITEHKRSEAVFWKQANFDALTNLPNRRLMLDRWEQAVHNHRRSRRSMALMLVDLDRFKEVNDSKGHAIGDELLMQAARRMEACLRSTDTLARLGGDEFAIIITDVSKASVLEGVAQKIIHCLSTTFDLLGHEVLISGSLGVSLYPAHGASLDDLLTHADQAMYGVKKQGGNGYCFFSDSP
jgi:diguanylate cyclase (GGDEF)-like protein/PAS domain S-box-containing protein